VTAVARKARQRLVGVPCPHGLNWVRNLEIDVFEHRSLFLTGASGADHRAEAGLGTHAGMAGVGAVMRTVVASNGLVGVPRPHGLNWLRNLEIDVFKHRMLSASKRGLQSGYRAPADPGKVLKDPASVTLA